jgi:Domain of unknown function (DUF1772)
MFEAFQVFTVMAVALSVALSLAHALELPGKMRLDEATYRAVQRIYYPGFTIGGIGDVLGVVATALLALLTPSGSSAFWLVLIAFIGMLAMNLVYWIAVHPVNKHWVAGQPMRATGAASFCAGGAQTDNAPEWTALRDRWEYAHVVRAVLASASLLALVISLVSDQAGLARSANASITLA